MISTSIAGQGNLDKANHEQGGYALAQIIRSSFTNIARQDFTFRSEPLPRVAGHEAIWIDLFKNLFEMVLFTEPSGSRHLIYISCKTSANEKEPKQASVQKCSLQVHSNISSSKHWKKYNHDKISDSLKLAKSLNTTLHIIEREDSGILYQLDFMVKQNNNYVL